MKTARFAWILLLLTALPALSRAQGDTTPLVKEQARLEERFRYLQELMKRLARRYAAEKGEEHHERLLQEGLDFIRSSRLEDLLAQAKADLEAGRTFSARKKQKEAEAKLQELYDILLERRRSQDFEKEYQRQERNLREVEALVESQKRLQEKTRKIVEESLSREEKALMAGLEDLARRQEELAKKTESLQPPGAASLEEVLRELKALSKKVEALRKNLSPAGKGRNLLEEVKGLLGRQKELGAALARIEKGKAAAARLRSLAARAKALPPKGLARESDAALLAQEAAAAAAGPEAPQALRRALKDFRRLAADPRAADRIALLLEQAAAAVEKKSAAQESALKKAYEEQAQRASRTASRAGGEFPRAARHLEKGAERNRAAARELARGNRDQAAAWNEQALLELEQALAALRAEGADPGRSLREAAGKAGSLARRLLEEGISKKGSGITRKAAGELTRAGDLADEKKWREADRSAASAQASLEEVIRSLSGELEKRLAGIQDRAARESRAQQALEKEAERLQAALEEAARRGKLTPAQKEAASAAMKEARRAMKEAAQSLKKGRLEGARKAQGRAAKALRRAAGELRSRHRPGRKAREALARLAKEQEALERKILQLARRMDPRKDREPKQDLEQAAAKASQASRSLRQGDPEEGSKRQEEARRKLEEARDEVARKRDHYLNLRQEELLLNMKEELKKILTAHREVQRETKQVALRIEERNGLVGRATRRALRRLASREKDLAGSCAFLRKTLEKEGSLIFSRVLLEAEQDLEEIARLLTSRPPVTGALVQGIQEDVARSLERLLAALKREVARRKRARGKPSSNRGPRKRRLVPPVAELKMLKSLQEDLLRRTRNLEEEAGVPGAETLIQAELERLANRQNDVNQVFKEFLRKIGLGKKPGPPLPGKKPEKEKSGR